MCDVVTHNIHTVRNTEAHKTPELFVEVHLSIRITAVLLQNIKIMLLN
jgi:hypothetical protein